ncbi:MAG: spore germination protein [Bacillota bacterium]
MFRWIRQWLRSEPPRVQEDLDLGQREALLRKTRLAENLEANLETLQKAAGNSPDLKIRRFKIRKTSAALVFFEEMVSSSTLSELLHHLQVESMKADHYRPGLDWAKDRIIDNAEISEAALLDDILSRLALGDTAVIVNGCAVALMVDTKGWETRSIIEPTAETSLRGSREGFVESLRVNLSLVRRRVRTPNLWVEKYEIGHLTRTGVAIAFIKGLASEELLAEVRSRLQRIDTDAILESGQIEEFIGDAPFSLYPTVLRTERPDRVAAAILEGRVAILTDGTPFALVVPAEFIMFLQAPDDYYEIVPIGVFIRALRGLAGLVAAFLPGVYVAALNFHPELLPTSLLIRITATREGVPFPVAFEIFFIESVFELLREAGIRLPRAIGPAISIVGALVLGEAAIRAGVVSPGAVIVVALTAIASFAVPVFSVGIVGRLVRFAIIILGAVFGLFGVQFGLLLLSIHVVSLRSFGVPYFSPLGPLVVADLKDAAIRVFTWQMVRRPKLVGAREPVRQRPGQRPRVGREGDRS